MSKQAIHYNVAIVDDHELFPVALKDFLKEYKYMHVKGIYKNGKKILENFEQIKPDIVFMDIEMPEMDGAIATHLIMHKYPETRVIALSMHDDGSHVKKMLKAGAWSFVTKDLTKKIFKELMACIKANKRYISPSAALNYTLHTSRKMKIKEEHIQKDHAPLSKDINSARFYDVNITRREREVIGYMMKGYSDKQIAKELSRSARTIDSHKRNIMEKLNIHKATEIVALAYKYNLL